MNDHIDEFIEEYKKLEEAVRRVYKVDESTSVVTVLKQQKKFDAYKSNIQSCANLRNFYQHNSKINNKFIADVSVDAVEFVKNLTAQVNNRERCRDCCVMFKYIYWRSPSDSVKETMKVMQNKLYTHIPILENNKVVGVFDENSLFSFLAANNEEIFEFDDKLTFNDMKEFIKIYDREMEEFRFFGINRYLDEAVEEFEDCLKRGKRLGLMLFTASGKEHEDLQGLITPWDLIGH